MNDLPGKPIALGRTARLSENIPELERWLVQQAQKGLLES